jgi:hypothetical protein
MGAKQKFLAGKELSSKEILELSMVDRCRYVVGYYFHSGFSAGEVAQKLNELHPDGDVGHYTPMEVHEALVEFYGKPCGAQL